MLSKVSPEKLNSAHYTEIELKLCFCVVSGRFKGDREIQVETRMSWGMRRVYQMVWKL